MKEQAPLDRNVIQALKGAFEVLAERDRVILDRLIGMGDGVRHSVREVAAAMNVSETTIRRHRSAALRALRRRVGKSILAKL